MHQYMYYIISSTPFIEMHEKLLCCDLTKKSYKNLTLGACDIIIIIITSVLLPHPQLILLPETWCFEILFEF